jgi:regulator of replication initiation timing
MDLQSIEERLLRVESILSSERRVRRKLQRENAHLKLEISSLKERLHAAEESIRVLENQPIMSPIIPQGITAAK